MLKAAISRRFLKALQSRRARSHSTTSGPRRSSGFSGSSRTHARLHTAADLRLAWSEQQQQQQQQSTGCSGSPLVWCMRVLRLFSKFAHLSGIKQIFVVD